MHEMQTVAINDLSVCQFVSHIASHGFVVQTWLNGSRSSLSGGLWIQETLCRMWVPVSVTDPVLPSYSCHLFVYGPPLCRYSIAVMSAVHIFAAVDMPRSHRRTAGDRAFAAAGPTLWNSLPHDITDCVSLTSFCRILKTFLFSISFP